MTEKLRLTGKSNWETIAFLIIDNFLSGSNRVFLRSQLLEANTLHLAVKLSIALGHKRNPEHPEETLQNTLQKMRDRGYIEFLGHGEYKLTNGGSNKMVTVKQGYPEAVSKIKHKLQEEISKLDQLLRELS